MYLCSTYDRYLIIMSRSCRIEGEGHSWEVVAGFGAHIRATPTTLSILCKGEVRELPLSSVGHLLIVGGHNLHTSVVTRLLGAGSAISFFDADGTPISVLRPFGSRTDEVMRSMQEQASAHKAAVEIARSSLRSRLLLAEKMQERIGKPIFYQGEEEFLHHAYGEMPFLIKMDELRRLHKLCTDTYYEIMARSIPPEFEFRRRTARPHRDPVNAMLSLGYALLFGNCCIPVIGANMDPDIGMLHEGERALVNDLMEPLKASMVDAVVFEIVRKEFSSEEFDCSSLRCHLSRELTRQFVDRLHETIVQEMIDLNVETFRTFVESGGEFQVRY